MNQASALSWEDSNQASLIGALADLHKKLAKLLPQAERQRGDEAVTSAPLMVDQDGSTLPSESALDTLCATFGLSSFERKVLLMCAAVELDSRFPALYAKLNEDARPALPTFSLALAAFDDAHWSALLPRRALRHWHLVDLLAGDALTTSPLRIDERILHYLTGMHSVDQRVRGLIEPVGSPRVLLPTERAVAQHIVDGVSQGKWSDAWPVFQMSGSEAAARRAIAAKVCEIISLDLYAMSVNTVPRSIAEIDLFIRLWEREAALRPSALLLEYDDARSMDEPGEASLKRFIETLRSPLLVSVAERIKPLDRRVLSYEVPKATPREQIEHWYQALGVAAPLLNGKVEGLVSQFHLSAVSIDAVVAEAGMEPGLPTPTRESVSGDRLASALWDACRGQSRPRLEGLAQRIEPSACWDDLVLPEKQKQVLAQIVIHVKQRTKVYETWGFVAKGARGLGISALFSGASGTGKTMAAEVLANQLRLDLYRIDLSQVISKYIGETEKNLRRVFDAADDGAAILLFDEADALFGKRSDVKDSHDRYANIEISYLLQRMEAYRGLAILTTNRKEALDTAFLRRIRFAVEFPFPEAAQRAEIWLRIFPPQTPTEGLRIERLARLSAPGGNIHNIAMGAAFLAADAGEPVRMSHLLSAARSEFTKIERPLTDLETAGWV
jgi:ATP-dependent 26S proteasome regulatory subunit